MTAEEELQIRMFVEGLTVSVITKPSRRDEQVADGPSDVANRCGECVGRKIAASFGMVAHSDDNFSLKARLGTAVHEKLERDLHLVYPHAETEITVIIGDTPNLG